MRSKVIVASALTTLVAATLAACGSGGSPSSPATVPNNVGGGTSPTTSQSRPGQSIPAVLIDGGTPPPSGLAYAGFNVSTSETETTNNAGSDTLFSGSTAPGSASTPQPYPIPINPPGTHLLTFLGNGLPQQIIQYQSPLVLTVPPLVNQSFPTVYAELVFQAAVTLSVGSVQNYEIELTGGSSASKYDVRVLCNTNSAFSVSTQETPTVGTTAFNRYVCPLPPYGSASGTYSFTVDVNANITGITFLGNSITNAVAPGATGVFTPGSSVLPGTLNGQAPGTPAPTFPNAAALYIVLDEIPNAGGAPNPPPLGSSNTLEIDYVYASALLQ